MTLVTTVGGASGPLYGSLLMGIGKGLKAGKDPVEAFAEGVESVKKRGKSDVGAKTMLDVLVPVLDALRAQPGALPELRARRHRQPRGDQADAGHPRPRLVPGRALDRPRRSGRHLLLPADPRRVRRAGDRRMSGIVAIVIVSHSPKVAEGAADMVRQMVGDEVPCAWTGGNPAGGLGTDALRIRAAIEQVWNDGRRRRARRSRRGRDERRDGDRDAAARAARRGCGSATRRSSRVPWSAATEASGGATLERSAPRPRSWARDRRCAPRS